MTDITLASRPENNFSDKINSFLLIIVDENLQFSLNEQNQKKILVDWNNCNSNEINFRNGMTENFT